MDLLDIAEQGNLNELIKALDRSDNRLDDCNFIFGVAATYGHIDMVKYLLSQGADVNIGNGEAIRNSAECGNCEMVTLLLDNGADIHSYGDYPIRIAVSNEDMDMIKLLASYGANIHGFADEALYEAARKGRTDVIKCLKDSSKLAEIKTLGTYSSKAVIKEFPKKEYER